MPSYPTQFTEENLVYDNLIACNAHHLISRKVVINSGQVLTRGAVLGKITAGGNYTLSLSGAGDGSQDPDAILSEDIDASGGDTEAMAYFRGDFNENALTLGTAHTVDSIREGLRVKGIALVPAEPANV